MRNDKLSYIKGGCSKVKPMGKQNTAKKQQTSQQPIQFTNDSKQCYNCGKFGHMAKDWQMKSLKSKVQSCNKTTK